MTASIRHLSVRVPWHDTDWTGRVCRAPSENGSCLVLPRIAEERLDAVEDEHAGADWDAVAANLPPCVRERAGFMRDKEFATQITHPYASRRSPPHEHLKPLILKFPRYSAPCVPFRWMRRKEGEEIAEQEGDRLQAGARGTGG